MSRSDAWRDGKSTRSLHCRRSFLRAGVGAGAVALGNRGYASPARPPLTSVIVAPGGDQILAGSQVGVSIHDAESLHMIETISVSMDQVHDLQFTPDGQTLAVVGGNPSQSGIIEWLEWPRGKRRQRATFGDESFYSLAFSPHGDRCAIASLDESCYLAPLDADQPEIRYQQHSGPVLACCFLPADDLVVSAGQDQTLRLWEAATGKTRRVMHHHTDDVSAVELRPGHEGLPLVASASADHTVRFWQPTIGRMVRFSRLESRPLAITWQDNGGAVLAACADGTLSQIDPDTVEVTTTAKPLNAWAYAVTWDSSRQRSIVAGLDGQLRYVSAALMPLP